MHKNSYSFMLLPNNNKTLKFEKIKNKNKSWIIKIGQTKNKEKQQKNIKCYVIKQQDF